MLELNPDTPGGARPARRVRQRTRPTRGSRRYARLLYDQAVIAEGSKVADPAGFCERLNDLIAVTAKSA